MQGKHETMTAKTTSARASASTFFGHPKGLFYLAFTEAWERFSYYGMTALVVLYMVNQLLLAGHVEHVCGFSGFRAAVESVVGPLSTQALASQIFGLYSGFVYFTPLLGGMIADRWIGQRNAVVIGALSMSAGHIAMGFDQSFLLALLLLVIGSGFLKGNISAQVGALYPREEEAQRTRGFVIFSTGINIGAVTGPMVCGLLAQVYGWHYGFGIAALFMLVGLATYLYGYRYLPARVEQRNHAGGPLSPRHCATVAPLIPLQTASLVSSATLPVAAGVVRGRTGRPTARSAVGACLHESVRREHPDRLGRQFLQKSASRRFLGPACRHRRRRRPAPARVRAAPQPGAGA